MTEHVRRAGRSMRPGLDRARTWTRDHWTAGRDRLAATQFRRPSDKALWWTGGVTAVLAVAVAVFLALFDWNWFRGPVSAYASARLHRQVTIDGNLNVHLWSWQPSATAEAITVADPKWAGTGKLARIDRLYVKIRVLPLLKGDVDIRALEVTRPQVRLFRDAGGRSTWDFSDGKKKEPTRLPPIRRFIIEDGKLEYRDVKRRLRFSGAINATEKVGAANRGFEMAGAGSLNGNPFKLMVTGGPLLNIDKARPYPFDADIRSGATHVTAKGAVPKPFDMGQFYMDTTAQGPDLADLYDLTGVALPNTPPYVLHGRLSRDEQLWTIAGLGGRVGDSDLTGKLSVDTKGERPFLKAALVTRSLDFDDLAAIFGGAPKVGRGETASAGQVAMARHLNAQRRLMPDATLKVDRIRSLDADVDWRAATIRDAPISLQSASLHVTLDKGLLTADPVRLTLPRGQVAGSVKLNARGAIPVTDLDLRLTNARVEQLIPIKVSGTTPVTGTVLARARLHGAGDSIHKAIGGADGEVTIVVPGGEIREAFAELLGVDLTKGLGLLFGKNQDRVPVRCAVAHFTGKGGVLTADHIVFDTGPVLVDGRGTIDMNTERLAFRLQGHPKEFRLVRLIAPITLTGPIANPKVGIEKGKVVAQGGLALALAGLSPLAAILPFVGPGLAKDANCGALIADAARNGAPVRRASR